MDNNFLQVSIKSICLTMEAGVGHRTVPMLLAKSSFKGDVKNWSTLINLHSELNLEVTHKPHIYFSTLILNLDPKYNISLSQS